MDKCSTDNEVWEDIEGYEGKYQVSNLGGVRSLDRYPLFKDGRKRLLKGKVLKPVKDHNGRLYVKLSNNENVRKKQINIKNGSDGFSWKSRRRIIRS